MGFSKNNKDYEVIIAKFLKKSENEGLKFCEIKVNSSYSFEFSSRENFIGKIYHFIKTDKDLIDDSIIPLGVWKIIDIQGGFSESTLFFEFLGYNYNYLPKGEIIDDSKIYSILNEKFNNKFNFGNFGINSKGYYCYILGYKKTKVLNSELTHDKIQNPNQIEVFDEKIFINYIKENFGERFNDKNFEFFNKKSSYLDDFLSEFILIDKNEKEELENNCKIIDSTGEIPDSYNLKQIRDHLNKPTNEIISVSNSDNLENFVVSLENKKILSEKINRSLLRITNLKTESLEIEIREKMRNLEILKKNAEERISEIRSQVSEIKLYLEKEIKKVNKLIVTLSVYSGIDEEIIQIREGQKCTNDEPINLFQRILFMDEESLIKSENGGLDFKHIEEFDFWLSEGNNIDQFIPFQKGVVVCRPRRLMKDRNDLHPIIKLKLENLDKLTYIIIRNGDNIYRIFSEYMPNISRLFPLKNEFISTIEKIEKNSRESNDLIENLEDQIFNYKKNFLLLQGIMVRTNIFDNLGNLNMLDHKTFSDKINFVYDEENTLGDGRPSFNEWLLNKNKLIKKGKRIFVIHKDKTNNFPQSRFSLNWNHDNSAPPMPNTGVYQVKEFKKEIKKDISKTISIEEYKKHLDHFEKLSLKIYLEQREWKLEDFKELTYKLSDKRRICDNDFNVKGYCVKLLDCVKSYEKYKRMFERLNKLNFDSHCFSELKETVIVSELKISYNPKDKIYAQRVPFSDGSWSKTREMPITFILEPNIDNFYINYEDIDDSDLDYYINNRIQRQNYLVSIPILIQLKKEIIKEKESERLFADMLCSDILKNHNISKEILTNLIFKSINWWKKEVVKINIRGIDNNNIKAYNMIKEKTLMYMKKDGFSYLDFDPRNQCYGLKIFKKQYHVFGLTKKEFVERIYKNSDEDISKKKINDLIFKVTDNEIIENTKKNKGLIFGLDI